MWGNESVSHALIWLNPSGVGLQIGWFRMRFMHIIDVSCGFQKHSKGNSVFPFGGIEKI